MASTNTSTTSRIPLLLLLNLLSVSATLVSIVSAFALILILLCWWWWFSFFLYILSLTVVVWHGQTRGRGGIERRLDGEWGSHNHKQWQWQAGRQAATDRVKPTRTEHNNNNNNRSENRYWLSPHIHSCFYLVDYRWHCGCKTWHEHGMIINSWDMYGVSILHRTAYYRETGGGWRGEVSKSWWSFNYPYLVHICM